MMNKVNIIFAKNKDVRIVTQSNTGISISLKAAMWVEA